MELLECQDALIYAYTMTVSAWSFDECPGVEQPYLYYKARVDGVTRTTSRTSGCPASWTEHFDFAPNSIVEIELWNVEVFNDREVRITTFCFRDAADECTTVPLEVLHDGGFTGPVGASTIELQVDPHRPL